MSDEKCYLRSYEDGDAHLGRANGDGTVTARCGVTFRPQPGLFDADGDPSVRWPVDSLQPCPRCQEATAARKAEDPDGVAVRGLIETLSSPRLGRQQPPPDFWEHGSVG